MIIKKANKEDCSKLLELENELFEDPWNMEMILREIEENEFANLYVAKEGEILIGFIDYWILFDQADIAKIAVKKEYQNQGIGKKLLEFALKKIDEENCIVTRLEVRESNLIAIKLYEKYKFKPVRIRNNYYNNENGICMERSIGDVYEGWNNFSDRI